jgi:hypothetical protein
MGSSSADTPHRNEMERKIDNVELRKLIEPEIARLNDWSIGFVLPSVENKVIDASLGGSGTLVKIDEIQGILTANHVVERLKKNEDVGLILTEEGTLHHLGFKIQDCSRIALASQEEAPKGPDVSLLLPPPHVLSVLSARKSFYNLSMRRERVLHRTPPLEHGLWLLSGFAGEWTQEATPEQGFVRAKRFKGMLLNVKMTKEYDEDGFDYLVCEALYNESYEGPDSYGGYTRKISAPRLSYFRTGESIGSGTTSAQINATLTASNGSHRVKTWNGFA